MTKRIHAAFLVTVILLTLAGCANKAEISMVNTAEQTATITATGAIETDTATEYTEEKKNGIAEETPPAATTEPQVPSTPATEPTETEPAKATPSVTEPTPTETTPVETKLWQTEPTRPPMYEDSTAESEISPSQMEEQPTETVAKDTEPKQETQPPTETTEPEPAPFDIDYWIAYAKGYAESKGLVLNHTAIDCWDNPIRAGAHCLYLERDIQSRLNRYAKDADITDVWIWAEPAGNDCYDIYIGYA